MKKETIIEITLDEKSDYQNKFNEKNLSSELSNYIYEECQGTPITNDIKLIIFSNPSFSEEEQKDFYEKVHKNYGVMVKEEELMLENSNYMKWIFFFVGVILVALAYLLQSVQDFILSEVILIVAWLSIWEAASGFFFENNKKRVKIRRLKKLSSCEIEFRGGKEK